MTDNDDARAEAERRYPNIQPRAFAEVYHEVFVAGAEWAAGRAETTTATTEEWAHRLENGGAMIWPTREQAEADREDYLSRPRDPFEPRPPASAGIWRREVTAWTEVDG